MCGRYNLISPAEEIIETFGLDELGATISLQSFPPPATTLRLARTYQLSAGKDLNAARWGLVPHWSKEPKTKYSTINTRAETVADKPVYREPFKHRRCFDPS